MSQPKKGWPKNWPLAVLCCCVILALSIAAFSMGVALVLENSVAGPLWLFISAITYYIADQSIEWKNRPGGGN
ncbi:hypothetical protein [Acetobacter sp. AAB5]|uniref:hypothetical protein n=1 Tax=Acetobacter sp. AAB5 TaxID=3418370 RepID=UPI003CF54809